MMEINRCTGIDPDFSSLVALLDQYLAEKDGREHDFYNQYNGISDIKYAVVIYSEGKPIACGAIKEFAPEEMEIKRMFTHPSGRGKGFAGKVISELENWGKELGARRFVLETGKKQIEAIKLYEKSGFLRIPNYGQYIGIENSVCFEKVI
jgi:GNAT superfamily N-acetyltransferase